MVGLVLYISGINDEMLNRTKDTETYFNYKYGWSFAFAAISFLLTEVNLPRQAGGPSPTLSAALLPPQNVSLSHLPRARLSGTSLLCPGASAAPVAASCADPGPQPGSKSRAPAVSAPLLPPPCRARG